MLLTIMQAYKDRNICRDTAKFFQNSEHLYMNQSEEFFYKFRGVEQSYGEDRFLLSIFIMTRKIGENETAEPARSLGAET